MNDLEHLRNKIISALENQGFSVTGKNLKISDDTSAIKNSISSSIKY